MKIMHPHQKQYQVLTLTIFWFHDENTNDDQSVVWKDDTMQVMRPKGRGAGLMVPDLIEERDSFLRQPQVSSSYNYLSMVKLRKVTGLFKEQMGYKLPKLNTRFIFTNMCRYLTTHVVTQHMLPMLWSPQTEQRA